MGLPASRSLDLSATHAINIVLASEQVLENRLHHTPNTDMLPNFFVIGVQKAGTTSLHHYLSEHWDIYLPPGKETKFFIRDDRYALGLENYEKQHFSGWNGEKAVGEVDPDIIFFPEAMDRMEKHFGLSELKFILLLRQPVDRAFSHYLMSLRRGFENENFERAVTLEKERIGPDFHSRMNLSYTSRGFYHAQIMRFLERIDQGQLLVRLSDDLKTDTDRVLADICHFLEVDPTPLQKKNRARHHQAMTPKSRLFALILGRDSLAKRIFKALFPFKNVRAAFRTKLLEWNLKNNDDQFLDPGLRKRLFPMFEDDVTKLERFMGISLDKWRLDKEPQDK